MDLAKLKRELTEQKNLNLRVTFITFQRLLSLIIQIK